MFIVHIIHNKEFGMLGATLSLNWFVVYDSKIDILTIRSWGLILMNQELGYHHPQKRNGMKTGWQMLSTWAIPLYVVEWVSAKPGYGKSYIHRCFFFKCKFLGDLTLPWLQKGSVWVLFHVFQPALVGLRMTGGSPGGHSFAETDHRQVARWDSLVLGDFEKASSTSHVYTGESEASITFWQTNITMENLHFFCMGNSTIHGHFQ